MRNIIALSSLVLTLGIVNWGIAEKENHLLEGRIVYLALAPVDPRSIMQGDYMALNFRLAREVYDSLPKATGEGRSRHDAAASDGYVVVTLDEQKIGSFKAIYADQALFQNEILMRYRVRNGTVKFATNAFFFQEGHGKYYQSARFGQFRVNEKGELLLTAMCDQNLTKLEPMDE
ncbi:MAG: GDYXXLXY domain-containing protein [Nitrospirales bacterium]